MKMNYRQTIGEQWVRSECEQAPSGQVVARRRQSTNVQCTRRVSFRRVCLSKQTAAQKWTEHSQIGSRLAQTALVGGFKVQYCIDKTATCKSEHSTKTANTLQESCLSVVMTELEEQQKRRTFATTLQQCTFAHLHLLHC